MNFSMKLSCLIIVASSTFWVISASAKIQNLPTRETPRPVTSDGIPHIQIDVAAVPEIAALLLDRVSKISGVELRRTIVGRAGSTGFWLKDGIKMTRPDSIIRGREFAHSHPDGSLHISLPPELANQAIEAGWAVHHPWAAKKRGLEGFVMIYTPVSEVELDVVFELVKQSYEFVTGND
jgi:phospholipase/carboxylesterase